MTSFQAEPPTITIRGQSIQLRPFGRGANRIFSQLSNVESEAEKASAFVVAFAAIYSMPPACALRAVTDEAEFNRVIGEADMELSSADLLAVDQYLAGIFQRTEAAAVSVDSTPGKP